MIDWFYFAPIAKMIPLQTFRYAVCGGGNLVLNWFIYATIYNFILNKQIVYVSDQAISAHIAALLISFPITFFTGFWLQKYITFTYSPLLGRVQLFRYIISVSGSVVLNYLGLKLFVDLLNIYPTPSQAITSLITVGYSYFMQKYFTFRGCTNK